MSAALRLTVLSCPSWGSRISQPTVSLTQADKALPPYSIVCNILWPSFFTKLEHITQPWHSHANRDQRGALRYRTFTYTSCHISPRTPTHKDWFHATHVQTETYTHTQKQLQAKTYRHRHRCEFRYKYRRRHIHRHAHRQKYKYKYMEKSTFITTPTPPSDQLFQQPALIHISHPTRPY